MNTFRSLNAVGRLSQYSIKTELNLYQRCVLSTLLYGSECWRMTEHDLVKLSPCHTTSLGKIQHIFWPRTISNHNVSARCQQEDMETIITREAMALCWARAAQGCQLHHQSCNPLDPRGKLEAWSTEDNLEKNCGSGNEENEPQVGHQSEAGQRQTGVEELRYSRLFREGRFLLFSSRNPTPDTPLLPDIPCRDK